MLDGKIFTFLKVAELKNYTKAALELHMTQPAVTQHIKRLEEYYQCKLIDISGKSVSLTEAGKVLYHYANLQKVNDEELKRQLLKTKIPLHIGATLSIADYYLDVALTSFLQEEQESFSLTVGNTEQLLDELLHGKLDCAFIEGIFDTNLFESKKFCTPSFRPVAAVCHPLSNKTCTLDSLYEYPLLLRESGSGTRAILENFLYLQNSSILSFSKVLEIGSFHIIKQLLPVLHAVSFMYERVAREEIKSGKLCYLNIQGCEITHPLYLVYLKNCLQEKRLQTLFSHFDNYSDFL